MPNVRILFPAFALSLAFVACEDSTSSNNSDGESLSGNSSSSGASPIAGLLCSKNETWDEGYSHQSFSFLEDGSGTIAKSFKNFSEVENNTFDFDWSIQGDSVYVSLEEESMTLSYTISNDGIITLLVPSESCTSYAPDENGYQQPSTCIAIWKNYSCVIDEVTEGLSSSNGINSSSSSNTEISSSSSLSDLQNLIADGLYKCPISTAQKSGYYLFNYSGNSLSVTKNLQDQDGESWIESSEYKSFAYGTIDEFKDLFYVETDDPDLNNSSVVFPAGPEYMVRTSNDDFIYPISSITQDQYTWYYFSGSEFYNVICSRQ